MPVWAEQAASTQLKHSIADFLLQSVASTVLCEIGEMEYGLLSLVAFVCSGLVR